MRKRKKGKGKGKKGRCPSVENIVEKIGTEMEGEMCVMNQLGWIDENGNPDNKTMTEDLMTLPEEVSSQLTEQAVGECAMDLISQWSMDPEHAKCMKEYSEEELAMLQEIGAIAAGLQCFHDMFQQSCKALVTNQIYQLYAEKTNSVQNRQLGSYATCLNTCQAANFASTTTCTFSCFFGSYTRTCNQVFPVLAAING